MTDVSWSVEYELLQDESYKIPYPHRIKVSIEGMKHLALEATFDKAVTECCTWAYNAHRLIKAVRGE